MKNSCPFYLNVLIIFSLLVAPFQFSYANLVPVEKRSTQLKKLKHRVDQKVFKRSKRRLAKRAPNKSNFYGIGLAIVGIAALFLVPIGIILIIAGLTSSMPILWIVGISIIAGIILTVVITWVITLVTLNSASGQLS